MDQNSRNQLLAAATMIGEDTIGGIVMTIDNRGTVNVQVQGELMPLVFMERALQNFISRSMIGTEVRRGSQ